MSACRLEFPGWKYHASSAGLTHGSGQTPLRPVDFAIGKAGAALVGRKLWRIGDVSESVSVDGDSTQCLVDNPPRAQAPRQKKRVPWAQAPMAAVGQFDRSASRQHTCTLVSFGVPLELSGCVLAYVE